MKKFIIALAAFAAMVSCSTNPFLKEWKTPYGIPPYDEIKAEHYMPAIEAGMAQYEKEIEAIVSNPAAPDFDNVIGALDRSGEILAKVTGVLFNVAETDNSPELEAIVEEATPLMTAMQDNTYMNKDLYAKVAAVWNSDQSGLTREQQMLLKKTYEAFERNGIGLDDAAQEELRQINSEMAVKINKIGNNILAESNAF